MAEEKRMPGFMTYKEAALLFTFLEDEEAAAAIKAACNYYLYDTITPLEGRAQRVFESEMDAIDRGRKSYVAKVKAGRDTQKKRREKSTP